jgi:NADP-dependent 3-hydroxy acid dehydrogenase YdfG
MPLSKFRDKVAIVTGAASGIGRALVEHLVELGASAVVLTDVHEKGLRDLAGTLMSPRLETSVVVLDVTAFEDVKKVVRKTAATYGRVDLMFNNAGVAPSGSFSESHPDLWSRTLDINVNGILYGTWAAYDLMVDQGFGHITNTASLAGLVPVPGASVYAATKHAVVGFSTSFRAEAALHGVGVSAVCPAFVNTRLGETTASQLGLSLEELVDLAPGFEITPNRCARAILKGVARNRAVITVPTYAAMAARLYGIWPWIFDALISARIARRNDRLQSSAQGSDSSRARAAQQGDEADRP